jgi:hypothetical protein
MRKLLMLLLLLSAIQCGKAQSLHLKFDHFTVKDGLPTGKDNGLELSLINHVVVKGHEGSMQVNSKEGDGSEFIIQLLMI